MSEEIKKEIKEEVFESYPPSALAASQSSFSSPFSNPTAALPSQGSAPHVQAAEYELKEPGAVYTCGNCTKEIFLTSSSPLQCPSCEHLTGSSSVFYKIRTQATTYDTI